MCREHTGLRGGAIAGLFMLWIDDVWLDILGWNSNRASFHYYMEFPRAFLKAVQVLHSPTTGHRHAACASLAITPCKGGPISIFVSQSCGAAVAPFPKNDWPCVMGCMSFNTTYTADSLNMHLPVMAKVMKEGVPEILVRVKHRRRGPHGYSIRKAVDHLAYRYIIAEYKYDTSENNPYPRSTTSIDELSTTFSATNISSNNDSQYSPSSTGEGTYGLYGSTNSSSAYPLANSASGTYPASSSSYASTNTNYSGSSNPYTGGSNSTTISNYDQGGRSSHPSTLGSGTREYDYSQSSGSTPTASYQGLSSMTSYPGASNYQQSTAYPSSYQPTTQQSFQQDYTSGQGSSNQGSGSRSSGKSKSGGTSMLVGFYVMHSRNFKPGQVFKVLWSEPMGSTASGQTEVTNFEETDTSGQSVSTKMRRFIVIRSGKGHSQCVPILTYGFRGLTKPGVHADEHAIIYTEYPQVVDGESVIAKNAIRMVPKTPQDKLNYASRINYAKVYTIEHNIPVKFIGHIAEECQKQFSLDYEEQWNRMIRFE
ncbi:hypothetical protein HYFRA_00009652 [Hymenoscyphus fraxineus]|uniref:DUF6590 domain-containing protein n=1 Tax=Hymenoscyphus fraxineus TaxID=746836 RepID=A0A9N9KV27_9HELO|nr:hypothetical protein HYFRA_00009652 [Hymenoscyphus fraxineus]